jgi:hypothetical protein
VLATNRVRTQFQDNSDLRIRHALHFSQDPGSTLTQWQAIEFGFQGIEKCCAADFFARITQTGISFFPEFVHIGGAGADFSIEIRDLARTDREQPGLGARAPLKPRKLAPRSDAGFLDDVVDVTLAREQSTGKSIQVRAVSADDDVEGRVIAEWIHGRALPQGIRGRTETFTELAEVYKQLNAPVGQLGRASLVWSNSAVTGNDKSYARYLRRIADITERRDRLAAAIKTVLNDAAFHNRPVDLGTAIDLGVRARILIEEVRDEAEIERRFTN